MTATTREHPAVSKPMAALATGQVLAAPGLIAQNKAALKASSRLNDEEILLRQLYPGGEMDNVSVAKWTANPNGLIKVASKNLFAAWTNSSTLIYYNHRLVGPAPYLRPYVLFHESKHVLQFQNNNSAPPLSYIQMLDFELSAYPETEAWVKSFETDEQLREVVWYKKYWKSAANYANTKSQAKAVSDDIFETAKLARSIVASRDSGGAGPDLRSDDEIYHDAMIATDGLPKLPVHNNVTYRYSIGELYEQDPKILAKRKKDKGY